MDITIYPRHLYGSVEIIPSKSMAHRLLICSSFADKPTELRCPQVNGDIMATIQCLTALGARFVPTEFGFYIIPTEKIPSKAVLPCGESGSTLRFMLPIVGALGVDTVFQLEGRLPQRPITPLVEEMERKGCTVTRLSADIIGCAGHLRPGTYQIDGSVSSQYITGFMLALAILDGESTLEITGMPASKPYISMTKSVLRLFDCNPDALGREKLRSPGIITVEGDWSNGAFFLIANFLGNKIRVAGLNPDSVQGDRAVNNYLELLRVGTPRISMEDNPDLVPALAIAAACCHGAIFTGIGRLRTKESDRVLSTTEMLNGLGGHAEADEDSLTIYPTELVGGTIDSCNDHRIAMSAAIASTVCTQPVTVLDAQSVNKSYPTFWDEFSRLGGAYEQCIR